MEQKQKRAGQPVEPKQTTDIPTNPHDVGEPAEAKTITVRIGKVPGSIKQVTLDANQATVAAALRAAGLADSVTGYEIKINANPANLETPLTDNCSVLLVRPVEGN